MLISVAEAFEALDGKDTRRTFAETIDEVLDGNHDIVLPLYLPKSFVEHANKIMKDALKKTGVKKPKDVLTKIGGDDDRDDDESDADDELDERDREDEGEEGDMKMRSEKVKGAKEEKESDDDTNEMDEDAELEDASIVAWTLDEITMWQQIDRTIDEYVLSPSYPPPTRSPIFPFHLPSSLRHR